MSNPLTNKGFGRIYVEHAADVDRVKTIIKELDEFEWEYLPKELVAPISEYPHVTYTYKFDALCMNRLTMECWKRGIKIFALDNGKEDFVHNSVNMNIEPKD